MSEVNLEERLMQCRRDKAAIERQEKELLDQIEAAETPELRHGDFGYYGGDEDDPVIVERVGAELQVTNKDIRCGFDLSSKEKQHFVKVGNVFDLLRERAETEIG